VLKVVSHLVVTLVLIVGYVVLVLVKGEHDPVLQNVLILAVGYWFGAVQLNALGKANDNSK
jgi:hypothetical protein